ncbi:MAG: type II toxin-antitoxin system VapC family toxin [Nitrososphaerota archaeon]|nr:type II toxin-antitoxin system VapC family toxin [Nitrososphaerota archaeon]MDG7012975.1 type II toxin-antitoxin system VapC family toxin [Nitrososphaerota archaeon]MDG7026755.1 type II toxin-antitoxin system VapC family toxin [Nitrososphaerota archaeon]
MTGTGERSTYLDSSAIVKRYVAEEGSDQAKEEFRRAYAGEHVLAYSVWNIGEVLGALDRARSVKRLAEDDYRLARGRFIGETRRMVRHRMASVFALKIDIIDESWKILESAHICQADALQLATAKAAEAARFLTGDERLHAEALKLGLNSALLGTRRERQRSRSKSGG